MHIVIINIKTIETFLSMIIVIITIILIIVSIIIIIMTIIIIIISISSTDNLVFCRHLVGRMVHPLCFSRSFALSR